MLHEPYKLLREVTSLKQLLNQILLPTEECDSIRIQIFQEYVNGGLEILQTELQGIVDYSEQILLLLNIERNKEKVNTEEFDLSRFL